MKKIIYINLDGFSYSYYELGKKLGKTAVFDALSEDGFLFSDLRSGIISITNPMQASILSGAWSNKTHNFYQHYDSKTKEVVKHYRRNDAENVAAAYSRNHRTTISIHQFMLENSPCQYDLKECCYFRTETMPSNYEERLEILKKVLAKRPVISKEQEFVYEDLPDFISVYIDDLDSLGHNNKEYDHYPIRSTLEERTQDILERMEKIQEKLCEIVRMAKEMGLYEDLIFLVTTDHGMTKFEGKSLLPKILENLHTIGSKASLASERNEESEVILLPYNKGCSVYYDRNLTPEKQDALRKFFYSLEDVEVLDKKTLLDTYSMDERAPEYLLFAKGFGHFYHRDYDEGTYGASHDSLDETSQHVFGMVFGSGISRKGIYKKRISCIDLIPTLIAKVHGITLQDATGVIHQDFFEE